MKNALRSRFRPDRGEHEEDPATMKEEVEETDSAADTKSLSTQVRLTSKVC